MYSVKQVALFSAGALSLVYTVYVFIFIGIDTDYAQGMLFLQSTDPLNGIPDLGQYGSHVATLPPEKFPLDDLDRRVIVVGDVHGMNNSLHSLLQKLSYDLEKDTLIHVGDILTKAPHRSSMAVLSFMASHNITGVRGNHEQKIIEWRTWMDWIQSTEDGKAWFNTLDGEWERVHIAGKDDKKWLKKRLRKIPSKWRKKIPKQWKLFSDHYRVARQMSEKEFQYLLSLPLILHVPSAHTSFVHAGVLPSDPRYSPHHRSQPLSKMPIILDSTQGGRTEALRNVQELAILKQVKPNKNPWVNLNMRSVTKRGKITRENDDKPWADLWGEAMEACTGFDKAFRRKDHHSLYCLPSTVIYGHAASRDLDVRRWSVGLDTGCVYERRLTAMVIGGGKTRLDEEPLEESVGKSTSWIPYGDQSQARIVSVKCRTA